jgi:hypothetical protein
VSGKDCMRIDDYFSKTQFPNTSCWVLINICERFSQMFMRRITNIYDAVKGSGLSVGFLQSLGDFSFRVFDG